MFLQIRNPRAGIPDRNAEPLKGPGFAGPVSGAGPQRITTVVVSTRVFGRIGGTFSMLRDSW